jgi:hypothetical protein
LSLLERLVMVNTLFLVWLFYKVSYSSKKKKKIGDEGLENGPFVPYVDYLEGEECSLF